MEHKLDLLISKIKTEGIQSAENSAKTIISDAEKRAEEILAHAKVEAGRIIADATRESQLLEERGKDALKQAERDLILTLELKLKGLFEKYVAQCTQEVLNAERLVDIIRAALSSLNVEKDAHLFVHVSKGDAEKIAKSALTAALKSNVGLEIKVDTSVSKGFRISQQGGDYAFDFTADAISEALSTFLTPNVQGLLR